MNELDELIPLADVPKVLAKMTGQRRKRHIRTIRRWATKGVGGRVLRTKLFGGIRATTLNWLDEFFEELKPPTKPERRTQQRRMTARDHAREGARSMERLRKMGVIQ